MKTSLFRNTAIALALGLAGVANASSITPTSGTTPFSFTVVDTNGAGSGTATFLLTTAPTGTSTSLQFVDTNPPGGQSATNIGDLLETSFGLSSTALTVVDQCDQCSTNPMVIDPAGSTTFNYLAVHLGGSELLFHFLSPVLSASINLTSGGLGGFSDWRAYTTSAVPLPGAAWLFLSALGVFGLRRKFAGGQSGSPTAA
jgi:hypothetical protein